MYHFDISYVSIFSFFTPIITPDKVPVDSSLQNYLYSLPAAWILAQWQCWDRLDSAGM